MELTLAGKQTELFPEIGLLNVFLLVPSRTSLLYVLRKKDSQVTSESTNNCNISLHVCMYSVYVYSSLHISLSGLLSLAVFSREGLQTASDDYRA